MFFFNSPIWWIFGIILPEILIFVTVFKRMAFRDYWTDLDNFLCSVKFMVHIFRKSYFRETTPDELRQHPTKWDNPQCDILPDLGFATVFEWFVFRGDLTDLDNFQCFTKCMIRIVRKINPWDNSRWLETTPDQMRSTTFDTNADKRW